jgi:hypothetical protein
MQLVSAKFIPRHLVVEQTQITGDEMFYKYDVKVKQESSQWK